jgi:hypothetical protein
MKNTPNAEATNMNLTPAQAKRIILAELQLRDLPFTKLTARTIGFSDLGRGSRIFVQIHGWQPNAVWAELDGFARRNGFSIEAR